MGKAVCFASHQHEGDGVEDGEAGPHHQNGLYVPLAGNGLDDLAEQNGFRDGDDGQHRIGDDDHRNTKTIGSEILQRAEIDLQQ